MRRWTAAKVAVSGAALLYIAWTLPLGDALDTLALAALPWVLAGLAFKALAVPCSAEVWGAVLDPALRPGRRTAARAYFASLHAGLVGPGNLLGDAYRVAIIGGRARADAGIAAIGGERAVTLAALATAAALGAWLSPAAAPWRAPTTALALLALAGLALGLVAGERVAARVRGDGFAARLAREAFRGLARLRGAGPAPALAAVALPVLTAASTWALFMAIGQEVEPAFALFAANLAALVVLLPVSVQGLGVREGAFVLLFTGLAGIPAAVSLAASLLSLASGVALGLLAGAALWWPAVRRAPQAAAFRVLALPLVLAASSPLGSLGGALERLLAMLRELMSGLRDEMSYLPPGSAPLVMIFGGLFVLALALVLSLLSPTIHPGQHPRAVAAGPVLLPAAPASHGGAAMPPLPPNVVPPPAGAGRSFEDGHAVGKALALADLDAVLDAAERMGLGQAHLVSVEPHRQVVRLAACQTCRLRPQPGVGSACEFERGFLEGAARGFAPRAVVTEALCNRAADGACEFELRGGG